MLSMTSHHRAWNADTPSPLHIPPTAIVIPHCSHATKVLVHVGGMWHDRGQNTWGSAAKPLGSVQQRRESDAGKPWLGCSKKRNFTDERVFLGQANALRRQNMFIMVHTSS